MHLQITICRAVGKSWIIIVTKLHYILSHGKTCAEYIYFYSSDVSPSLAGCELGPMSPLPSMHHQHVSADNLQHVLMQQDTLFRNSVNSWGGHVLTIPAGLNTKTFLIFSPLSTM